MSQRQNQGVSTTRPTGVTQKSQNQARRTPSPSDAKNITATLNVAVDDAAMGENSLSQTTSSPSPNTSKNRNSANGGRLSPSYYSQPNRGKNISYDGGLVFDATPEITERLTHNLNNLLIQSGQVTDQKKGNTGTASSFFDALKGKNRSSMECHMMSKKDHRTDSVRHPRSSTAPVAQTTIITKHSTVAAPLQNVASEGSCDQHEEEQLNDIFSFVVDQPDKAYAQFMQAHKCYDVVPVNTKLVILDTSLDVRKAFFALVYNSVRSALLWDGDKMRLCGMLSVTDFIHILLRFYRTSTEKIGKSLESHLIKEWKDILLKEGKNKKLVSIPATSSLYRAVQILIETKYHRLPVVDEVSGNPLYFLTHKRILRFLYLYLEQLPKPSFMHSTVRELGVGTYSDVLYVHTDTPLHECLAKLVSRNMSAVPVVERHTNVVVDIYARFDAIGLAAEQSYDRLGATVAEALQHRKSASWYEGVLTCHETDTLWTVAQKLVLHEVHGLVVVDAKGALRGVITLSDVLRFMVLTPIIENEEEESLTAVLKENVTAAHSGHGTDSD